MQLAFCIGLHQYSANDTVYFLCYNIEMHNKIPLFAIAASALFIIGGYLWLNTMDTRDFNFGPPFVIMTGTAGLIFSLITMIFGLLSKRGK